MFLCLESWCDKLAQFSLYSLTRRWANAAILCLFRFDPTDINYHLIWEEKDTGRKLIKKCFPNEKKCYTALTTQSINQYELFGLIWAGEVNSMSVLHFWGHNAIHMMFLVVFLWDFSNLFTIFIICCYLNIWGNLCKYLSVINLIWVTCM